MDITMKAMEMMKHNSHMMNKDMTHKDNMNSMHKVLSAQGETHGMMERSQFPPDNPLTAKGEKIMSSMRKRYGGKKGKQIFYASANKGKIRGVHK